MVEEFLAEWYGWPFLVLAAIPSLVLMFYSIVIRGKQPPPK